MKQLNHDAEQLYEAVGLATKEEFSAIGSKIMNELKDELQDVHAVSLAAEKIEKWLHTGTEEEIAVKYITVALKL